MLPGVGVSRRRAVWQKRVGTLFLSKTKSFAAKRLSSCTPVHLSLSLSLSLSLTVHPPSLSLSLYTHTKPTKDAYGAGKYNKYLCAPGNAAVAGMQAHFETQVFLMGAGYMSLSVIEPWIIFCVCIVFVRSGRRGVRSCR